MSPMAWIGVAVLVLLVVSWLRGTRRKPAPKAAPKKKK